MVEEEEGDVKMVVMMAARVMTARDAVRVRVELSMAACSRVGVRGSAESNRVELREQKQIDADFQLFHHARMHARFRGRARATGMSRTRKKKRKRPGVRGNRNASLALSVFVDKQRQRASTAMK